jgi:hypothetical protein
MSEKKLGTGLDVGTSFLVVAREAEDGNIKTITERDAFFEIQPATKVHERMIKTAIEKDGAKYLESEKGVYLIGQYAIDKANERHKKARRPLSRGVISPKEKQAVPILKFLLKELVGDAKEQGEPLYYSIPAMPVDQDDEEFDTGYHQDVIGGYLATLGYKAVALNEAEAIAYSELLDDALTGMTLSFGAGMVNAAVMSSGDPVLKFSTTKAGDWIDRMAAVACNQPDTLVQAEKESGIDLRKPANEIQEAISIYYQRLLKYTLSNISTKQAKGKELPKSKDPINVVVSGGTSLADGFIELFKAELRNANFPLEIGEVRRASDQLTAVAKGCYLAASMDE